MFAFAVKASADSKTNHICLTSLTTPAGKTYKIPTEHQSAAYHAALQATSVYSRVKKTLTKRHQIRKVWITLTKELKEVYLDSDQNFMFNELYLEEETEAVPVEKSDQGFSLENLAKLLGDRPVEQKNLGRIAQSFSIMKFSGRNANAAQWIQEFNSECTRVQTTEAKSKIELLRGFLEGSSGDWYRCMLIKHGPDSEWTTWEATFLETFANKGWSPCRYAYSFKYHSGSLLEYALKKEKLLLELRKEIDTGTLIDLIAFGLPNAVLEHIDRNKLGDTSDLYQAVGKLDHLAVKTTKAKFEPNQRKSEEKIPCKICIAEKKGTRYHPEEGCWFKDKPRRSVVRAVNNSELEIELNEKNPKN